MTKTPPISIRLRPSVKKALDTAARDSEQTFSGLLDQIVAEWLVANGYLTKGRPDD